MKKRIEFGILALAVVFVMCSQTFAVTYTADLDETIQVDRITTGVEIEDEYKYTYEDAERAVEIYKYGMSSDEATAKEELAKYDLNGDGIIDVIDAACIFDLVE